MSFRAGWLAGFARMGKNRFHLAVKTRGSFFSLAEMQFASHLSGMSEEEGSTTTATRLDGWMDGNLDGIEMSKRGEDHLTR